MRKQRVGYFTPSSKADNPSSSINYELLLWSEMLLSLMLVCASVASWLRRMPRYDEVVILQLKCLTQIQEIPTIFTKACNFDKLSQPFCMKCANQQMIWTISCRGNL